MDTSFLDAAVDYAKRGWWVHPIKPVSKHPNSPNGFKDATTDIELITDWWSTHEDNNIGIATGHGLYVLDIDGPRGEQVLNDLVTLHGPLPETLMAQTGRGIHYFFSYEGDLGNTAKRLGEGVDTRGEGGYVIVAPSIHENGKRYKWLNEGTPLAPLPKWIIEAARKTVWLKPKYNPSPYTQNLVPYVRKAWEASQDRLSKATEGTRNDLLNIESFTMGGWISSGSIDRQLVEERFQQLGEESGLSPTEVWKTIQSGIQSGMEVPLYVPEHKVYAHDSRFQQNARMAEGTIIIRRGSSFGRRGVSFFWNRRIPLGELTILAGNGGIGKSFLTLSLAAHVTAGESIIDLDGNSLSGEVLFCSYEDEVETSIGPRADALGVDLDKTHFICSVETEHGPRDFGPQDVGRIVDYLEQCPEIKLIIIDPLGSFMGAGTDSSAENQMRSVLGTLTKAAQKTGAAIIMVAHRNKQALENPTAEELVKSICGSQAIAAIARSVLLVERDDEDLRWVKHVKANHSRLCPDVSYAFDEDGFMWNSIRRSPQDLAYWLKKLLKVNEGEMSLQKIAEWAKMKGITDEELNIGQTKLGVEIIREGENFIWKLKD